MIGTALTTLCALLLLAGCGDEPAGIRFEIPDRPTIQCDPPAAGGECARDLDCDSATICARDPSVAPMDLEASPLACSPIGTGGAPGAACAMGVGCVHGLCAAAGTCVEPCTADADCGIGMRCAGLHVRAAADAFEIVHGCVDAVDAPDDVVVVRSAIDSVEWSRGSTLLSLSAGRSLTIIAPNCSAEALATRLVSRGVGPATLFDYGTVLEAAVQANWIEENTNPTTVLLPNGSGPVSEAGHDLTLQTEGEGGAETFTLMRSGRGALVDIDLFYVGARDWTPTGDRGPTEIAAALDYLDERLSASGLRVGTVRQHEITGGLRRRFQVLSTGLRPGEEDERGPLFALSAGARGASIPIFLVRTVVGALGRSGGVPGPAGVHGTAGSGIVIGPDLIASQTTLSRAIAHEAFHFLGVFHTTEATGLVKDPIFDTPTCTRDRDVDGDGFLSPEECDGAGADNLMFWAASGDAVTEGQSVVLGDNYVAR